MAVFQASSSSVEIIGGALLHALDAMKKSEAFRPLLARHGLDAVKGDEYVSQQRWLDLLRDAHGISPSALEAMMERVFLANPAPLGVATYDKALASLDLIHQAMHRGGKVGHWRFEKKSDSEYELSNSSPYPCELGFGVLRGLAQKFGKRASVVHGDDGCRMQGAARCRYLVRVT